MSSLKFAIDLLMIAYEYCASPLFVHRWFLFPDPHDSLGDPFCYYCHNNRKNKHQNKHTDRTVGAEFCGIGLIHLHHCSSHKHVRLQIKRPESDEMPNTSALKLSAEYQYEEQYKA